MSGFMAAMVWLIIAIILFVIEGATVQMVCLWFAIGSLVAMASAFLGAVFWLQLALFLISSIAALVFGRPYLKDKITPKKTATNADAVIGQRGVVLEEIDNGMQTGRVSVAGLDWTARSANDTVIPARQKITVLKIDGVKLVVKTAAAEEEEEASCQLH